MAENFWGKRAKIITGHQINIVSIQGSALAVEESRVLGLEILPYTGHAVWMGYSSDTSRCVRLS
jgi:hypothetical protein